MKVLITGASGGIGLLTAITLANRHHLVYLTVHKEEEKERIRRLVDQLKFSNIEVLCIDITSKEDRNKLLNLNFDCLINNAASAMGGSVLGSNFEKVRDLYEVNVFSSFELIQKVYKKFRKNKRGRIIVLSSLAAYFPVPFLGVYSSSKASIRSLVTSLQIEEKLLDNSISFILIEPGLYHTGFNQYMLSYIPDDKVFTNLREQIYKIEDALVTILEKKNLTSIVTKIILAVEEENPKSVYRAPFLQALFCKIYSIFRS